MCFRLKWDYVVGSTFLEKWYKPQTSFQGKDWLNLSEGQNFDVPQYDHDEPNALKVNERKVAISNLKTLGVSDVKGGHCDSRNTWIFEMAPPYSLQQVSWNLLI